MFIAGGKRKGLSFCDDVRNALAMGDRPHDRRSCGAAHSVAHRNSARGASYAPAEQKRNGHVAVPCVFAVRVGTATRVDGVSQTGRLTNPGGDSPRQHVAEAGEEVPGLLEPSVVGGVDGVVPMRLEAGGVGEVDGVAAAVGVEVGVAAGEEARVLGEPAPGGRVVVAGAEADERGVGVVEADGVAEGLEAGVRVAEARTVIFAYVPSVTTSTNRTCP